MPTYPPEFIDWLTQRVQLARESADDLFKLPGARGPALEQEAKASAYSDVLEYIEANISGASQKASVRYSDGERVLEIITNIASQPKKAWKPTDKQLRLLHRIVNARETRGGMSYYELTHGEQRVANNLSRRKLVTTTNFNNRVILSLTDAGYALIGEAKPD